MYRAARCLGVGLVVGCGAAYAAQRQSVAAKDELPKGAFRPDCFLPFKLQTAIDVSHDTKLFRFELPPETPEMGLPVASCIVTRYKQENGEFVVRPYTPTTLNDVKGHFDLIIKKYPNSKMGSHFFSLQPGDTVDVKGPILKQKYEANKYKHIGMIAGGTGITPMYQVVQEILKNPGDKTEVDLIYGNKTPDDVLLKKELDALARDHSNFRVHYTVDKPGWMWRGNTGFITPAMISQHFPSPRGDCYVMVCGPQPMMESISGGKAPDWSQGVLKGALKDCGYTEANVFKF